MKKKLNQIFGRIIPNKETRMQRIKSSLENTLNQMVSEINSKKFDEYFFNRLNKQYKILMNQAEHHNMDVQKYTTKYAQCLR